MCICSLLSLLHAGHAELSCCCQNPGNPVSRGGGNPLRRFSVARLSNRARRASLQGALPPPRSDAADAGTAASELPCAAGECAAARYGSSSLGSQGFSQAPSQGRSQGVSQGASNSTSQGPGQGQGQGAGADAVRAAATLTVLSRSRLRRGGRLASGVRSLLYVPPQRAADSSAVLGQARCVPARCHSLVCETSELENVEAWDVYPFCSRVPNSHCSGFPSAVRENHAPPDSAPSATAR